MDARALTFHLPIRPTHGTPVRFTNDDMAALASAGLIDEDARFELVEGEIFWMGAEGDGHAIARLRLQRLFIKALSNDWICATDTSWFPSAISELRPDLAIFPETKSPTRVSGQDIRLVAEVMNTSHKLDRELKRPVYARAGVQELWLIDLVKSTLEVWRHPEGDVYTTRLDFGPDDAVSSVAFPDILLRLRDLLV
jgi:hypothetical protein